MIRWLSSVLLVAGCATHPTRGPQPTFAVSVAPATPQFDMAAIRTLLQPCPIEPVKRYSGDEPTRLANARRDALIQCNKDKAAALDKLEHP